MAHPRSKDGHQDVAVEGGSEPYYATNDLGYVKGYGDEPGYDRPLRIRPGQSIEQAKREDDERMEQYAMPMPARRKK